MPLVSVFENKFSKCGDYTSNIGWKYLLILMTENSWFSNLKISWEKKANELPIPSEDDDFWRYSKFTQDSFSKEVASFGGDDHGRSASARVTHFPYEAKNTVLINSGRLSNELSWVTKIDKRESFEAVSLFQPQNKYDYLGLSKLPHSIAITCDSPQQELLIVTTNDEFRISSSNIKLRLEKGASLNLIEVVEIKSHSFCLPVYEFLLEEDSRLNYVRINVSDVDANAELANIIIHLKDNANVKSSLLSAGTLNSRVVYKTVLNGSFSRSNLYGASYLTNDQQYDLRTFMVHGAARSFSDMASATVLDGVSEAIYIGLIKILKGSKKAIANQVNKNLLVSKQAIANSIPNLDIEENDVRCDHASSVGPINEELIHYLESRTIPEREARELIIQGFLEDILSFVANEPISNYFIGHVKGKRNLE